MSLSREHPTNTDVPGDGIGMLRDRMAAGIWIDRQGDQGT